MQARLNGVYRETPDHGTSNLIFEIYLSKRNGTLLVEKLNLPSLQLVADLEVEGAFYTLCRAVCEADVGEYAALFGRTFSDDMTSSARMRVQVPD